MNIAILTPIYNDWESFVILLKNIGKSIQEAGLNATISVVAIDDGSLSQAPIEELRRDINNPIVKVTIVKLIRNLGHQKAIAIGMSHIKKNIDVDAVVIMDSDGEDRPEHVPKLIESCIKNKSLVAVAERGIRYESLRFRFLYKCFKMFFRILTGLKIDFGNFSCLSKDALHRLTTMSELWAQYPATIIKSKLPYEKIRLDRGKRYVGSSKMNMVSLITHAMGGLSVFIDRVFVRMAVWFVGILLMSVVVVFLALMLKTVGSATPGWASNLIAINILLIIQSIIFLTGGLLIVLRSNQEVGQLPESSAHYFIDTVTNIE